MPEYDAFGREIGEDTLAETGWGTSSAADSVEQARPAPVPRPLESGDPLRPPPVAGAGFQPPPPPPGLSPAQQVAEAGFRDAPVTPLIGKRRSFGCGGVAAVFVLVIVGAIGAGAFTLFGAVDDAVDEARRIIPSFPTITVPDITVPGATAPDADSPSDPAEAVPSKPPTGLRRGSLIKRANFAKAMRLLRAARLGNLRSLRVAADRIDVQLLTKGGALRNVQLRYDGTLQKFGSATPGFGHLDTFPYASVNTAAPERLTRAAARRLGKGADNLDYLVMINFSDQIAWAAFFKTGANFQADRAGNITRRIN